ncbi:MAG: exodeoxyribonuclease V subunit alpha [Gammaproteobacteria bacterium]|nr:exodeoxyribonuclease V subunit alpha [Gammaproteobacteria bacterium]
MLAALVTRGGGAGFSALDVEFARLMHRLGGDEDGAVALAAACVSRATAAGHVCVGLGALAGRLVVAGEDPGVRAPALGAWRERLLASRVCGGPGACTPLVLDASDRLYLQRYWRYEDEVAEALLGRAAGDPEAVDLDRLGADLARLFPAGGDTGGGAQKIAAAVAVLKRLAIVSGGPGTGKTSTVIRVLAALLAQPGAQTLRIALAAPTGKAANRLQEAVRAGRELLDVPAHVRAAIPVDAATLHRLLGARPRSVYFRHDRDHLLPVDVLIVDEASMIDLALTAKLLRALPAHARLVLLGDRDQLASVEAGAVLGEICAGRSAWSESLRARLERVVGAPLPPSAVSATSLSESVVLLERSYRFGDDSGIGRLARCVNAADAEGALALLGAGASADLAWVARDDGSLATRIVAGFREYLECVQAGAEPRTVFAAFDRFRVLCAHRHGPAGAEAINAASLAALQGAGLVDAHEPWYAGRPVMIGENDYELGLFNGDVGVVLADPAAGGELRVTFESAHGQLRRLAPARLPAHEPAFALTVHKAQGSEFDEIVLLLPRAPSPVLTRELLYTAITRARRRVEIRAEEAVLRAAIARRVERVSGLRDRLWPAAPPGAVAGAPRAGDSGPAPGRA